MSHCYPFRSLNIISYCCKQTTPQSHGFQILLKPSLWGTWGTNLQRRPCLKSLGFSLMIFSVDVSLLCADPTVVATLLRTPVANDITVKHKEDFMASCSGKMCRLRSSQFQATYELSGSLWALAQTRWWYFTKIISTDQHHCMMLRTKQANINKLHHSLKNSEINVSTIPQLVICLLKT